MSSQELAIICLIIFVVATVFSVVGQGGGILYVPVLLGAGIEFNVAATTSLFAIMATGLSAAWLYRKRNLVDLKLALVIEPPTVALAFLGGYVAGHVDPLLLKMIFAGALIVASCFMSRSAPRSAADPAQPSWRQWWRGEGDERYAVHWLPVVPASALAGFVAGMVGIAGGIFKLPAMVLLGKVPTRVAVGTSALMVGITALAGFSGHLLAGHFEHEWALPLAASAFVGAQVGSRVSLKLRQEMVRRAFAIILFAVACWVVWKALA